MIVCGLTPINLVVDSTLLLPFLRVIFAVWPLNLQIGAKRSGEFDGADRSIRDWKRGERQWRLLAVDIRVREFRFGADVNAATSCLAFVVAGERRLVFVPRRFGAEKRLAHVVQQG